MAHFLRGKQAGIQKDFSAGLDAQLFAIDEVHSISPRPVPAMLTRLVQGC